MTRSSSRVSLKRGDRSYRSRYEWHEDIASEHTYVEVAEDVVVTASVVEMDVEVVEVTESVLRRNQSSESLTRERKTKWMK